MIGNMQPKAAMRHIPEEELHAYLDQGLSRSQCVEIESHLAVCPACQSERDSIAALRDRTTALLAKLAPPRGFPPAFEILQRRAQVQASAHRRRIQVGAWAASLVVAVGLGWTANYWTTKPQFPVPHRVSSPSVGSVPSTPITSPSVAAPAILRQARKSPREIGRRPSTAKPVSLTAVESLPPVVPAPTLELTSVDIPRSDPELELDGMWRTLSWDGAQAEAGDQVPHIDGLPVVQVQLQTVEQGKQPLMVVAQQLSSGEVIRTIEGPMGDVSHLLAGHTTSKTDSTARSSVARSDSTRSPLGPDRADRTMAMQRGDRMLVITGALPSDSLLAMIRRLNAEMRSK
ncbi:MAG: anti-sigma factor family protein [Gemmatimonadales bacterium]